ncbi:50S ribosomal protein L33 [Candidatus Cyrtobacter comes]|uniref:Large ribosomal subunit protein bL33 n=1 Tax=Candidatus Cyrtobacter comes TaxID=675776 RepID=A0ABU5L9E7_9RICK|nr:50S ribosomal protein L33 [Candidatus Cyrtobacter comes]MDZ5762459.1 50S ribosomal protein L33 [Candidatus Cyrtobacter comes]
MSDKKKRLVKLISTGGTGFFWVKKKGKSNVASAPKGSGDGKLSFMKYDPILRKRVIFKEAKI